jgi:hypothetical protein
LVELYGGAFPAERFEAVRVFVVTTYGATVEVGGVSTKAKDATRVLEELSDLTAEVVASKRSLREALDGNGADTRDKPGRASGRGQ